MSKLNAII